MPCFDDPSLARVGQVRPHGQQASSSLDNLVRRENEVLSVKPNGTVPWMVQPGEGFEERCLACAVGSDEAHHFALAHFERSRFGASI